MVCYLLHVHSGLPSVVTLAIMNNRKEGKDYTVDDVEVTEALKRLEASGADVVGLNCFRGPQTMIEMMENIKKSGVKVCAYYIHEYYNVAGSSCKNDWLTS